MAYLKYNDRLKHILSIIEKGGLSSPNQLANTYSCSEKTIRNMINTLRELGYNIEYSKTLKKYIIIN